MKIENQRGYLNCRNCGKIVELSQAVKNLYCCPQCNIVYRCCTTCGRYFVPRQAAATHCSLECATIYKLKTPQENLYDDFRLDNEID